MKRWKTTTAALIVLALAATPALARPATADVPAVVERLASWLGLAWNEPAPRHVPAAETTVRQRSGEGEEDDGTAVPPPPLDESLLTIDPSG